MRKEVDYEFAALRQKFRQFYDEKLRQDYEVLEEKRQVYLRRFWLRLCILLLYVWGYFCGVKSSYNEYFIENDFTAMLLVLFGIFLVIYTYNPIDDYKDDAKKRVMNKILSFWGDLHKTSTPDKKLSLDAIKEAGLWGPFNTQTYDDCFVGEYKEVGVAVSEQKLSFVSGSGKNRHEHTVFKGVLIALNMDKNFIGKTVVEQEGGIRHSALWGLGGVLLLVQLILPLGFFIFGLVMCSRVNRFGWVEVIGTVGLVFLIWAVIYFLFIRKEKLQDVNLEDVEFEKKWHVRSSDQIEARCVLTPAFMERMLEVKQRFRGYGLEFAFWNNTLLIAVHTNKDMFETTSLFTPALNYHKMQKVITQFWAVFSVVDVLMKKE